MSVELTVLIGICGTILGAAIGIATYIKNSKKDVATEAKTDGIFASELGYIKAGIDDIKRKQEKSDEKYLLMSERLVKVEASTSQAHKRLDRIDGKENA